MKKSKRFSIFLKQVPLMVALLAAFVFSAGDGLRPFLQESRQQELKPDVARPDVARPDQAKNGAEPQEENERPMAHLDYAFSALAPVASFIFQQHPYIKAPLPDLVYVVQKLPALPPLRTDRYFHTLFRIIISPNAP